MEAPHKIAGAVHIAGAAHIDVIRHRLPAVAGLVSDGIASGHMTPIIAAASPAP
jgi:hypothetical protein